jgi:hypothetical protein
MHRISRQFALYIKAVCFTSHAYRYSIVYMCKHTLYEQNGRSKLFNLDFVWVTLEYGLFFFNCYEWCKFPFTQWSVDIILSKEPVFLFFTTLELYSVRCKKCKHTRQEKITIFRGKEKNRYFHIYRRPIFIPDWKSWPLININVIFNHISIIFIELIEEKRSFPSTYNCLGLWSAI